MATANERLRQGVVQHQVGLIRVGNQLRRQVLNHLQRTEADVRRQVADRAQSLATDDRSPLFIDGPAQRRLQRLERSIREARKPGFDNIFRSMRSELNEIAAEEPRFLTNLIRQVSPVELPIKQPNPAEITKIVSSRPFQGRLLRQWTAQLAQDERRRMMNEIRIGLTQGETASQVTRRIVGTGSLSGRDGITHLTRNHVQTLVRTAINHIGSAARREFALANQRLFTREQWVAVLDARTSHICLSLNGQLFDVGKGPHPPAHFNALAEGTLIETNKGPVPIERVRVGQSVLTHRGRMKPVTAVMAKPCDHADILRVETRSGRIILATDEHPVLVMDRGWVRADELQLGDQLFENPEQKTGFEGQSCVVAHADDYPSPFDQPLVPYKVSAAAGSMASSIDLDRDHVTGEREINGTCLNDMLVDNEPIDKRAFSPKNVPQRFFSFGNVFRPIAGLRNAYPVIHGRIMSGVSRLHSIEASIFKCLPLIRPLTAPMGITRRVDHWMLSDVVCITRLPHSSPLYNLSVEDDETYVAGGIVVHNCRSIRAPFISATEAVRHRLLPTEQRRLLREFAEQEGLGRVTSRRQLSRTNKRAFDTFVRVKVREMVGALPPVMTTEDFLAGLPLDDLEDVLGVTKARLSRRGGLSIGRLVDREGSPLTLAALAQRETAAFRKAGLSPTEFAA